MFFVIFSAMILTHNLIAVKHLERRSLTASQKKRADLQVALASSGPTDAGKESSARRTRLPWCNDLGVTLHPRAKALVGKRLLGVYCSSVV